MNNDIFFMVEWASKVGNWNNIKIKKEKPDSDIGQEDKKEKVNDKT